MLGFLLRTLAGDAAMHAPPDPRRRAMVHVLKDAREARDEARERMFYHERERREATSAWLDHACAVVEEQDALADYNTIATNGPLPGGGR